MEKEVFCERLRPVHRGVKIDASHLMKLEGLFEGHRKRTRRWDFIISVVAGGVIGLLLGCLA